MEPHRTPTSASMHDGHSLAAAMALSGQGASGARRHGGGSGADSLIGLDDLEVRTDGATSVAGGSVVLTPQVSWRGSATAGSGQGPSLLSLAMLSPGDGSPAGRAGDDGDAGRERKDSSASTPYDATRDGPQHLPVGLRAASGEVAAIGGAGADVSGVVDGGAAAPAAGVEGDSPPRFTLVGPQASVGSESSGHGAGGGDGSAEGAVSVRLFSDVADAVAAARETHEVVSRSGRSVPVWLDCEGTTDTEMQVLARAFALHPVTVKDCLVEDTSISDEKAEAFPEYLFVIVDSIFNAPDRNTSDSAEVTADVADSDRLIGRWQTGNLNLMVLDGLVLTSHFPPMPRLRELATALASHLNAGATVGADWVLFAAFESMVDLLVPRVTSTAAAVDSLDETILDELTEGALMFGGSRGKSAHPLSSMPREATLLRRIGATRRHLGQLHRSLLSKRGILTKLCGSGAAQRAVMPLPGVSPAVQIYLGSVLDRVVWQLERVEASRDTLHTLYSNYLTGMNVRVAQASVMTAQVMKSLTLLLTVTTPLTLVASVFGMNVYPLTIVQVGDDHDSAALFIGLCSVMFVSVVLMVWLAKRRGWL